MARPIRLKVNWFPVQIPQENLRVSGIISEDRRDYRQWRNVRQYRFEGQWYSVCVIPGGSPAEFAELEIESQKIPSLTSTLIFEAFLHHYEQQGFVVERNKGESQVLRPRKLAGLPEGITAFEGLLTKPFYITSNRSVAFGLVIDFATRQQFTESIAHDLIQRQLAGRGYEVQTLLPDGTRVYGILLEVNGNDAIIEWHGRRTPTQLEDVRVGANYQAIGEYVSLKRGNAKDTIRRLMVHSLSLQENGFAHMSRLADQYARVAELLGRSLSANINITLPTLCQSVISVATESADLELSAS